MGYRGLPARALQAQRIQPRSIDVPITAPVGGWNSRDALDNMSPLDAVKLVNFYPGIGKVSLRKGSAVHATGVGSGDVSTIAELHHGTTRKLIATSATNIYDATSVGAATSRKSGFTVGRWQHVNFNGALGMVNGTDAPQTTTDGITFSNMSITGPTAASLVGIFAHQSRTYFWENNSQDFWYSAVDALGGTLTQFPLSRVGQFGGNLICAGSWNVEGGSDQWGGGGIGTDLAVFVMSSGEAIVYEGDSPGTSWHLVGVYEIGAPLDPRGFVTVGGSPIILTKAGYVDFATVVRMKRLTQEAIISDKISPDVMEATSDFGGNTGWEAVYFPAGDFLLANVPESSTIFTQHVMNLKTKAWCPYHDLNGRTWGVYADELYFGDGSGQVVKAEVGNADQGAAIEGDAQTAYSDLGSRGLLKHVKAMRPVFEGDDDITISLAPQFDFKTAGLVGSQFTFTPPGIVWEADDTIWELDEETWGGNEKAIVSKWLGAAGAGYSIGCRLRVSSTNSLNWHSTTYKIESGRGMI